jgi:hypothetical protein
VERQSVSFGDPSATHKLMIEMAMSKVRADIEKENKKKPYRI